MLLGSACCSIMHSNVSRSLACCRPVLLGTSTGALLELLVDEKDKREKAPKQLHQLPAPAEAVLGLMQHSSASGRCLMMLATSSRLCVFAGQGSMEAVLEAAGAYWQQRVVASPCVGWVCCTGTPVSAAVSGRCGASVAVTLQQQTAICLALGGLQTCQLERPPG